MKQNFQFDTNILDLMKSENEDYYEIEGIASTADEDLEDEIVKQNFDLSICNDGKAYLIADHGQNYPIKDHARMGVIDEAKITKKGLWVKGKVWKNHPEATAYYNELKYKPGMVQFSVEGYTLERNPFNKNIVEKAVVTGVALTRNPVNKNTYAKLAKSLSSQKQDQIDIGKKIEEEHKDTIAGIVADVKADKVKPFEEYFKNIAEDHLKEFKDYYDRLVKLEKEAKAAMKKSINREQLIEFFKQNPNPKDSQVHKFAEDNQLDPHELEQEIYALLSESLEKGGIGSGRHKTLAEIEEEKRKAKQHHQATTGSPTQKIEVKEKENEESGGAISKEAEKLKQATIATKHPKVAAPEAAKQNRRIALQAERARVRDTATSKEELKEGLERIALKTRATARKKKEFSKSEFQAELIKRSLASPEFKKSLEAILTKALSSGGPAAADTLPDNRTGGQVFQKEEIIGATNKKCQKCKDKKCTCKGKN